MPHLSSIRQLVQVKINAISGVSVLCSVKMAVIDVDRIVLAIVYSMVFYSY